MAGKERRKSKANSTREPLLLATMAGQERFTCAEIQGGRSTLDHQIIWEDVAALHLSSLRPSEQRKKEKQP
jgi:hypothetical protein